MDTKSAQINLHTVDWGQLLDHETRRRLWMLLDLLRSGRTYDQASIVRRLGITWYELNATMVKVFDLGDRLRRGPLVEQLWRHGKPMYRQTLAGQAVLASLNRWRRSK